MSKYFYNGEDIGNIVSSSINYGGGINNTAKMPGQNINFNTDNTQGYNAFPGTKITPSNRDTVNLNIYSYQGSSIFNNRVPMHYDYNNSETVTMPFNGVNRLMIFMIGAGGGGAGGGNAAGANGHYGGGGGQGGLGLPRLYGLNSAGNYIITIGAGGNLGAQGVAGGAGGSTQFQSPYYVINTNGSNGGGAGNNGNVGNNGSQGANGNDGTSAVNVTNVGQPAYTTIYNYSNYIKSGLAASLNLGGYTDPTNALNDTKNTFGINTTILNLGMLNFGYGQGNTGNAGNSRNTNGAAGGNGFIRVYYLYN